MNHTLRALPYQESDLAPYLSAETIRYHYGAHHQGYVQSLNKLVAETSFANQELVEIIKTAPPGAILNNAAQHWNHTFYWHCLTPKASNHAMPKALQQALEKHFSSPANFCEEFGKAALGVFGSGWAWLTKDAAGNLRIEVTANADSPLRHGATALLTCDVWEHAYYLDYRNQRAKYLAAFWEIVNWDFVANNFTQHSPWFPQ